MPPEVVEQWLPLPPPSVAHTAASGYAALSALHAAGVRLMHEGGVDSNRGYAALSALHAAVVRKHH